MFTTQTGYENLHSLISLISNCNVFMATKEQEMDTDIFETIKVSKFYEMVFDKPSIGMAVDSAGKPDQNVVESWPIIQAYGLDSKFE